MAWLEGGELGKLLGSLWKSPAIPAPTRDPKYIAPAFEKGDHLLRKGVHLNQTGRESKGARSLRDESFSLSL